MADGPDRLRRQCPGCRIANNFAVGATYSYDDIFQSKATGYIRYGTQPLNRDAALYSSAEQAQHSLHRALDRIQPGAAKGLSGELN